MRGVTLHAGDVGITIGHAARTLTFMHHATQAFHGLMVCIVQGVESVGQQLHSLADATRLVNAALFADRQVHR